MTAAVEDVKQKTGASDWLICQELGLCYNSYMRWKQRQAAGEEIIRKPGPCKVGALELNALYDDICRLAHGRERTHGTGALFARYHTIISHRDLQELVRKTRSEMRRTKRALSRTIAWLKPGLVWSMDDAEVEISDGRKVRMHVVHDLGSRYTLCVLAEERLADGRTIAENLRKLFKQYGAPLFFKRDNGGNLNHTAVNEVLAEFHVIPLNSPPRYPPYNGAMEHKQGELKAQLDKRSDLELLFLPVVKLAVEVCAHELNHIRRRILSGQSSCHVLEHGRAALKPYNKRKRREVFEAIKTLAIDITANLEQHTPIGAETAFRYAAETWMQSNHIIRVSQHGKVLPTSHRFFLH